MLICFGSLIKALPFVCRRLLKTVGRSWRRRLIVAQKIFLLLRESLAQVVGVPGKENRKITRRVFFGLNHLAVRQSNAERIAGAENLVR